MSPKKGDDKKNQENIDDEKYRQLMVSMKQMEEEMQNMRQEARKMKIELKEMADKYHTKTILEKIVSQ